MPPEGGARVRMCCRKSGNLTAAENACVAVRHTLQNGKRPSEKRKAADTSCSGTV
ncbi:hypothetical protein [Kingella potus]|uniref:hypothetical protein n=1 Tax=Kingella potus TaxID=265175 RepID=UPI001FD5CC1B|nr:hypothetical protein [Kingella potus]UOP00704.1 hypothetical protein LVJ84_13055 [Kingella potus]